MPRRLVQLFAGLVLYGVSDSMLLLAGLGVDPWDVLHQGLARRTGVPVGTWAIIAGAVVLLLWIPLRQRPGLGTLCNAVLVGAVIDLVLAVVPPPHSLPVQVAVMASGVVLNGVATGMYIAAGRADDRVRRPRSFAPRRAHLHRGHGAAGRLAARRHRRRRNRGLRGLHRAASPHLRAPVHPGDDRSRVRSATAAWPRRHRPGRRPPACGPSSP
jgi:hypothetical protein